MLFQIGVSGSHNFFGNAFFMDQMGNQGFQERQGG
jgi:hypothetical protein